MSKPVPLTITMTHEKETPGTNHYAEDGDPTTHVIGTLYIKKRTFNGATPKTITVTVQVEELAGPQLRNQPSDDPPKPHSRAA